MCIPNPRGVQAWAQAAIPLGGSIARWDDLRVLWHMGLLLSEKLAEAPGARP